MVDPKKPRGRVSEFIRDLVPDWRPSRDQWLWVLRIVLVLAVLLGVLTLVGLPFDITLWDWLKLLIIPVVLATGGYLFTRSENRATQAAVEQRTQDEAFQAYLDQLGQLLLNKEWSLRQSKEGDEVRTLARARTLTVLSRLDRERKRSVVQFLYESGLITKDRAVLDLNGANLAGADLRGVDLPGADLSNSDLRGADLSAEPIKFRISGGRDVEFGLFITRTNLAGADLRSADLRGANLRGANLSEANLTYAKLHEANLRGANLRGANLQRGAALPGEFLEGATLPDGQKYEDWLKDREGSGDDGQSNSPS